MTNFNSAGDEMRINNNFGYANASIYLNGPLTMDSTLSANAVINIGELGGVNSAIIGPGNSSQPSPTWVVGWKNTTNTFAGTILDDNSGSGGQTSIIKVGTGAWYLGGQDIYSGSTIISNGILGLTNVGNGDASIGSSTNIFINAGAVLDVSGRSDDMLALNFNQVLSGSGTLKGILDTTPGGTVAPGGGFDGGVGTLTVTNDVNLGGGTVWMKLDRSASPNSDRLVAGSFINYNGTLVVSNIGPRLQAGDTFKLFDSGTSAYNNAFTTIVLPTYYTWDTSKLAVDGTIKVTAAAASPTLSANFGAFSSGSITLSAANGLPNGPVTVLSSTNLALPVADWTVVTTGNFDQSGNYTTPVTVDPTGPTMYFILSAQ